jgi:linoleoyl-CoA desaturase
VAIRNESLEVALRRFRSWELAHRSRPARLAVFLDVASRLVPMLGGYLLMYLTGLPELGGAVVFAVGTMAMLGSWFHDGVHTVSRPGTRYRRVLMRVGCAPVGLSPLWWSYKHVRMHHRYPANPELDPDIQFGPLLRVSSAQCWRHVHVFQAVYIWALLPLSTLNMLKPGEVWGVRGLSEYRGLGPLPSRRALLLDKYSAFIAVWAPLLLWRGWATTVLCFVVFELVAGTLASVETQVQHNTALADDSDDFSARWPLCEQLARTTDVGTAKGMWWWLSGGTNFHVAHHLIPSLTFFELPAATARLRQELDQLGIAYPVHRTLRDAVRSHLLLLRTLAEPPSITNLRPSENP